VNAVDRQMDVRVLLVPVRNHEHLMLLESEVGEHLVRHAGDRGAIHRVPVVE
jgi:hypothetical protein